MGHRTWIPRIGVTLPSHVPHQPRTVQSLDEDRVEVGGSARDEAVEIVADTLAELMGFGTLNRPWAGFGLFCICLQEPCAQRNCAQTELSKGSVSMTLADLIEWEVVKLVQVDGDRRRHYEACTDILAMVTRVFQRRELALVNRSVSQLERAQSLLDAHARSVGPTEMLQTRFLSSRLSNLIHLARTGRRVVQQMARVGRLDLSGIRGALRERLGSR